MQTTFENQLTGTEINQGLVRYLAWRMWFFPLVVALIMRGTERGLLFQAVGTVLLVLVGFLVVFYTWRLRFSPDKVAHHTLREDRLEITDSDGARHSFPWRQVRAVRSGDLILLRLPGHSFALIPTRNPGPGQAEYLTARAGR